MLLLVVIGVALLAFIIGDFFTSGRTLFGNPTTIAKVDGQSIDINDFQKRLEQANNQLQQQNQKMDPALLQQQVLGTMVSEKLIQQEIEALGLRVSDEELTSTLLGEGSMYVDMYVRQTYGLESAAQFHDIAFNPAKYNLDAATAAQFQAEWVNLEKQFEQMLLQQKLANLFTGAITANELDAKALYDENARTLRVAYVKKDYSSIPDSEAEPTEADINAWWAKHKELYRLPEQQRSITYIVLPIQPSDADIAAGLAQIDLAYEALVNEPGTEGVAEMMDFVVNRQRTPKSAITDQQIRQFIDTAKVGSAAQVKRVGYDYTLAKVLDSTFEVDSVNIDYAMMAGTAADVNAVIDSLNAGTISWESLQQNGAIQAMQDSVWLTLTDPNIAPLRADVETATLGRYFTPDTAITQGGRIMRVNTRKAPVNVVDYAVITYTIEPSRATVNSLDSELRTYAAQNNTPETFRDNAAEAGYTATPWQVSASVPQINNIDDTREAIQWALEAKKGQISPVFGDETTGQFIIVALNDIYDDYVPAREQMIEPGIRAQARNEKKAAQLKERYAGKATDLAGYAQLMEARIDTTTITFGQPIVPGLGYNESAISGIVSVTEPGQLTEMIQGNNGVVVLQVLDVDATPGRPYNYLESANNFNRQRGAAAMQNNLPIIIQGNRKVDNRINKFYRHN